MTGRRIWFRRLAALQRRAPGAKMMILSSMSNPMWAHIIRLLDDEEQAKKVLQIFKQAIAEQEAGIVDPTLRSVQPT